MKRIGLRAKLCLIYTGLFAAVLIIFGLVFYHTRMEQLNSAVNSELDEIAAGARGYLQFPGGKPTLVYDRSDPEQAHFIAAASRFFRVYDVATGQLLVQSPEMELIGFSLSPTEIRELASSPRFADKSTGRLHVRFHSTVVRGPDNRVLLMRIGTSLATLDAARREFISTFLVLVPVGILLAAAGGWWITKLTLRPVDALRTAAHEINIAQLDRQLPVRGAGDELDRLASTFNETFARIRDAVGQMREFSSAIAHELRTPITAMRGDAEVALLRARAPEEYRAVLANHIEELDKLSGLVEDLLLLARAESGDLPMRLEVVDLGKAAREVFDHLEPLAVSRGVGLQAVSADAVCVNADRQWLDRIIFNLVDNALKFTSAGGSVRICVTVAEQSAILEVSDSGTGIPDAALPHIFDRFYRADQARSREVEGVGLGLALVQTFVKAHHGRIQVESELGRGSLFRVFLPLAAAGEAARA